MSLKSDLTDLLGENYSFGMDIGTTCSYVAYKEGNSSPKVPNYRGVCQGGIPSLAWRDKNGREWFCDQVAEKQGLVEDPAGVWTSGKMKLGEKQVVLNGHAYTPRYLMIKEVQRVRRISEEALEQEMIEADPQEWVVGVPVRFSAAEKGELRYIVEEATGGKRVRLIPEPILAAVANDYFTKKTGRTPRKVLVLDMGGGTFDVVLLVPNEYPTVDEPHPYIALNPEGIRQAGDALDVLMEELILEKIAQNPGSIKMDILNNPNHYDRRRLRQTAKETKERLSSVDSCAVSITGISCGSTMISVTRAEYEDRIRPIMNEAVELSASVLKQCNLGENPDIDILLVGGSTYIPLLRQLLEKKFYWISTDHIMQRFPEKAVALGAAIYAQTPTLVRPKVAFGYGVNTYTYNGKDQVIRVIIPSSATLPKTVSANFETLDENQLAVKFSVYEIPNTGKNTHMSLDQGRLTAYSITHKFETRVPKGTPVRLTTTLSEDGVLTMSVEDFQPQKRVTNKTITMNNTCST